MKQKAKIKINNKIVNKTVLKEINRFKRSLKGSELSQQEITSIINQQFIFNPNFRFTRVKNNVWYDRFTKHYIHYTNSKESPNKYKTTLRRTWLKLYEKRHIEKIKLEKNLTQKQAEKFYKDLKKKLTLKQIFITYGS